MKFKTSFITLAGCAAMLGSSCVYAETDEWYDYQNISIQPMTGSANGAGESGIRQQRTQFIQELDLSNAQKKAITELRQKKARQTNEAMKALKESTNALRKLSLGSGAKQSEIDRQIDKRFAAMAALAKVKSQTRHIIYAQILSKEQQELVRKTLEQRMSERANRPYYHHGKTPMQSTQATVASQEPEVPY